MTTKPIITVEAMKEMFNEALKYYTKKREGYKKKFSEWHTYDLMVREYKKLILSIDTFQDAPESGEYIKYYPNKNNKPLNEPKKKINHEV